MKCYYRPYLDNLKLMCTETSAVDPAEQVDRISEYTWLNVILKLLSILSHFLLSGRVPGDGFHNVREAESKVSGSF